MNQKKIEQPSFNNNDFNEIRRIIKHVRKKISEQGPLEYFVHHNPLHHYEELPAYEAFKKASFDYDAAAFMPEPYYLEQIKFDRLDKNIFKGIVTKFLNKVSSNLPPESLMQILLNIDCPYQNYQTDISNVQKTYTSKKACFFDKAIENSSGININYYIATNIYKFFSAYFDFGSSHWQMEYKRKGIWQSFRRLHFKAAAFEPVYQKKLAKRVQSYRKLDPVDICVNILNNLKISSEFLSDYIFSRCYQFKGWAGFIKSLEDHPNWCHDTNAIPNFFEFVTVLLVCDQAAIDSFQETALELPVFIETPLHNDRFLTSFFDYYYKNKVYQESMLNLLPHLSDIDRQSLWHSAYENTFYSTVLSSFQYVANKSESNNNVSYTYQVICCLDDREESFRRYLELDKTCETFGAAGHFDLDISYQTYFSDHERALCPVVNNPKYFIKEILSVAETKKRKIAIIWCELQWLAALSSRTVIPGILQSFIGLWTSIIPFCFDIVSPKITYQLREKVNKFLGKNLQTSIVYDDINHGGIPFADKVKIAKNFLLTIGITKCFSPYIFIMGHGSSSLNNPHTAAYNCGACGGGNGGPNARIMALILNDHQVRQTLNNEGVDIPSRTIFVGGQHNTCNDNILFFDEKKLKVPELETIKHKIKAAAALNAKERCRRFNAIPYNKSAEFYHKTVQARSIDLRQPRPEYGHATNAICIIGPRNLSRQLFLDRRAFLVNYSANTDPDLRTIHNLLNTTVPVCSGINLEYYFSFIDNEVYGCGTKLPHNVNGLVGVINGYMSDLQLGLSWQMVEIHEPIRLLFLICISLEKMRVLLKNQTHYVQLFKNKWVHLSVYDEDNKQIYIYENDDFVAFTQQAVPQKYYRIDKIIMNSKYHLSPGEILT